MDTAETIKIVGNLLGHRPLILIDSGSSSTFICEQMAAMLSNWVPLSAPVSVRVADGTSILCTHEIRQCPIYIQGYCFNFNLKILPLKCYDIIIDMDWLEQYSPMQVHWSAKWISFNYGGQ